MAFAGRGARHHKFVLFTQVAVKSAAELKAVTRDIVSHKQTGFGGAGDFVSRRWSGGDATDVVSRVFVPGAGVDEDSVTGSAHAVLAPFWAARLGRAHFTAFQASERGGKLTCRLDGERVWLSGPCVTVVEGVFRLGPQGLR